jgi:site-specific DNA-adenine methylase
MIAPFPYFGGKRRVASLVWSALGDVDNYVEPFAGSLAVLLERPESHARSAETVNDADSYIANFWRALVHAPDEVAKWCDWPVNETDLLARHLWLVEHGKSRIESMEAGPDFYDAKVAGWWVWGINAWIGSGWCAGHGPWRVVDGKVENTGDRGGQWRQRPHLSSAGQGVNRQLPHLGDAGRGVNRKLPHLGYGYAYSERKRPENLRDYFNALADRLRRVRVCCGDWSRIVTGGALAYGDSVGVFLDPPYLGDVRTKDLYRVDNHEIADEVREWAIANGDDRRLRIVLAGYTDEHEAAMPDSWRRHTYSAGSAYQTINGGGVNAANRHKECLWFSPHCIRPEGGASLFEVSHARA